jgi:ribosomal-protein-alanine N-acetyltransferase
MTLIESGDHLSLMATSLALLDAEERGVHALAALLGVTQPDAWPPEFNTPETRAWMRDMLRSNPDEPGYGSWYIVAKGRLIGICGYKGPPNDAGTVEIGYSVMPTYQRQGSATAAVGLLIARAFRDLRVTAVEAETLPSLLASQAVLMRNGFILVSRRDDKELGQILSYSLPRNA